MDRNRRKIIMVITAAVVAVVAVAGGRHLLGTSSGSSAGGSSPSATDARLAPATHGVSAGPASVPTVSSTGASQGSEKSALPTGSPSATAGQPSSGGSGLPTVPAFAVTPLVVHTATLDMRVGRGKLDSTLSTVAFVAGDDGGYVDSSSVSGGTQRRSPVAGAIEVRVLDADFQAAITEMTRLGTVEDQEIKGKDVTVQVAQNAASLVVLQDEVNLLEKKLADATDTTTFLQIENQLLPVQQQLQQLQAAQSVLQNSAALATITVDLTAPGAPIVTTPPPAPKADAAATSWHYLRQNTLAVLDGLAVGLGWALPVLVLLALAGLVVLRVVRRRRQVVTPA